MPESPHDLHHALPSPERVEYHRKAAKELLRAVHAGDPAATGRLREALGHVPAKTRLADTQRAIAREHGHASWAAFRRELEDQAEEPKRSVARVGPGGPERYDRAASTLLQQLAGGDERARARLRAQVPRLGGLNDAALTERATVSDARLVVARENGFPTWQRLTEALEQESKTWRRAREHPESVDAAIAAIRAGDVERLRRLLDAEPALVQVDVGAGGCLLGEVAQPDVFGTSLRHSLGVDRACVDLLIERGSDLEGPLNLAACFDRVEFVEILLAAGARVDERGIHGITPLETAIYHGSRASADVLAAIELVPDALWVAAGAGRVDRLQCFVDEHGTLTSDAYVHRPNPGMSGGCTGYQLGMWLRTSSTRRSCTQHRTSARRLSRGCWSAARIRTPLPIKAAAPSTWPRPSVPSTACDCCLTQAPTSTRGTTSTATTRSAGPNTSSRRSGPATPASLLCETSCAASVRGQRSGARERRARLPGVLGWRVTEGLDAALPRRLGESVGGESLVQLEDDHSVDDAHAARARAGLPVA